jgi:hypothetical protein
MLSIALDGPGRRASPSSVSAAEAQVVAADSATARNDGLYWSLRCRLSNQVVPDHREHAGQEGRAVQATTPSLRTGSRTSFPTPVSRPQARIQGSDTSSWAALPIGH